MYTLPDAIASQMGRVMPLWFYEGQVRACAVAVVWRCGRAVGWWRREEEAAAPRRVLTAPPPAHAQTMLLAIGSCTANWLFTALFR